MNQPLYGSVGSPFQTEDSRAPYRTTDQRHLQQHYGERTSAELARELGRPSGGAIRTYLSRHPELRTLKA